jgi:hypothetical protein
VLSWSPATPELANTSRQIAVHVVNHALTSADSVAKTIVFLRGRLHYFGQQLPPGWQQTVRIDDRGQVISADDRTRLRAALAPHPVSFFTEPLPSWLSTS